jgi:hypothetical protein
VSIGLKHKKKSVISFLADNGFSLIEKTEKIRPLSTRRLVGEENSYEDKNKANKDDDGYNYHKFNLKYQR